MGGIMCLVFDSLSSVETLLPLTLPSSCVIYIVLLIFDGKSCAFSKWGEGTSEVIVCGRKVDGICTISKVGESADGFLSLWFSSSVYNFFLKSFDLNLATLTGVTSLTTYSPRRFVSCSSTFYRSLISGKYGQKPATFQCLYKSHLRSITSRSLSSSFSWNSVACEPSTWSSFFCISSITLLFTNNLKDEVCREWLLLG